MFTVSFKNSSKLINSDFINSFVASAYVSMVVSASACPKISCIAFMFIPASHIHSSGKSMSQRMVTELRKNDCIFLIALIKYLKIAISYDSPKCSFPFRSINLSIYSLFKIELSISILSLQCKSHRKLNSLNFHNFGCRFEGL